MGRPESRRFHAFDSFVRRQALTVLVPEYVRSEFTEAPDPLQEGRLAVASEAGWLETMTLEFTPTISKVVDQTRSRMAAVTQSDLREDEIEKTDTVLAGCAVQRATRTGNPIAVLVSDRIAERATRDVLESRDGQFHVVEGRQLLRRLLERGLE